MQNSRRLDVETLTLNRTDDGIVTVTLNRPAKKNAINAVMWAELLETFNEVRENHTDRVLVLTGAGGDFCSGADLSDDATDERHYLDRMRYIGQIAVALHSISKPIIAKVDGNAVGAGMNMALSCDLIVATERARFSEIFAKRGLSIDLGGSWILPRLIGMHKAKELALLGEIISAQEAERIGIVNRIVPVGEVDAFVDDWANRLAAGPPLALAMTKRMLTNSYSTTLSEALDMEGLAQTVNFGSEDTREAILAFLAKRTPEFHGR
jgi:2-(1,2-epoxy-1,2-dihydrophenyl)acetyl-CoA isomerase